MSVRYKVHALLAQWVRRYAAASNAWAHMMTFWLFDHFGVDPLTVLANPSLFLLVASGLPAFYRALLPALTALHGSLSQAGLIVGSADTTLLRADSLTCKSCYELLLSLNPTQPHCVVTFRSNCGDLDWESTRKSLFFMPLDRKPCIDLCWKVAYGVLYTAHRLVSFRLNVPPDCLCGHSDETLENCGLDWIQSLSFLSSPLVPAITMRHVLFGFIADELLCVPRVCCYLLSLLKFFVWFQRNDYRFRSKPPSAVQGLIARIKGLMSFYLSLLIKRFRSRRRRRFFQRQGGANGRIGKDVGDIHSFVSFLVSFERVSLARLCWLYCGLLGSVFFFFFFGWSVCVFPLFAPPRSPSLVVLRFSWALSWLCLSERVSILAAPLGRLCWFHYGFVSSDRFE